jgi:hypothetical protein
MEGGFIAIGIVCFFLGLCVGSILEERHSRDIWTRRLEQDRKERQEQAAAEKVQQ